MKIVLVLHALSPVEPDVLVAVLFFEPKLLITALFGMFTALYPWHTLQKPAPNRTPFYFKPENGVYTTEVMIYHRLLLIFAISRK